MHDSTDFFDIGAVLDAYYELRQLAGTADNWSERTFRDNSPRLYRFQRLQSLLRAFGLPARPVELEGGGVLPAQEPAAYQFLHDELLAAYQRGELSKEPRPLSAGRCGMLYQQFFRLLYEQYRLRSFNSGWLEAGSAEAQYAIRVAERFVQSYDHARLEFVRRTVCRLLDPAGRRFSRQELVRHFNFPDVNLLDIDIEWM